MLHKSSFGANRPLMQNLDMDIQIPFPRGQRNVIAFIFELIIRDLSFVYQLCLISSS